MRLLHDFHLSYAVTEERLGVKRPSALLAKERLRWIVAEERLGVKHPSALLAKERLQWIGHVLRSDDTILLEVLIFIPESGARGRGPRRRASTIRSRLI